jgi:4-amino-4-deoxy-L-arabinose transferase-like glycosyltransferase
VFGLSNALLSAIAFAVLVLHAWALVDCIIRPANAFEAAGKLTKPAWLAITAIALALGVLFNPLGLFGLVAIVASIVYLVDVRPAVKELQGGGGNRW